MLRFFSASNSNADTEKAVALALDVALGDERGDDVRLIVFHVAVGHDIEAIQPVLQARCPAARVVGCTCAGVIGREGANETMRAFALMAVKGEPHEVIVTHADTMTGDNSREVGRALAVALRERCPSANLLMLLGSGLDIAADEAITGVESVFGSEVDLFGGTSADNMKGIASFQVVDDRVYQHAAVLIGFADPTLSLEMQASHGFVPAGVELEVTRASANRIHELNGEPAWRAFTRALGLAETATPADTIPPGALGERLPDVVAQEYGDSHLLRVITRRDPDGTLYMPVLAKVGTRLSIMLRDEARIFRNLAVMMDQLGARLSGRTPVAVFHTDCGARGRLMVSHVAKEEIVADMQRPLFPGGVGPWLGMYGFGEITRLGGRNLFHNYTSSLYVIARR